MDLTDTQPYMLLLNNLTILTVRYVLCTQPRAPAPQSNVTFVDRAQAALNAAGAVERAGAALSAAQAGAATGNTNLVGSISNTIQAAQARHSAFFCMLAVSAFLRMLCTVLHRCSWLKQGPLPHRQCPAPSRSCTALPA